MDTHSYFLAIAPIWTLYFQGKISMIQRDRRLAYWRSKLEDRK